MSEEYQIAVLGGGCFWCLEAIYRKLRGVTSVISGYAGGHVKNPKYEDVCTGITGHAEVVRIEFNPLEINYGIILDVFWKIHDPTTLNRQGNDTGSQYRSAIFYTNEEQKRLAEKSRANAESSKIWSNSMVTEIVPLKIFYQAESYHDNYYEKNRSLNPYCIYIIDPKMKKLQNEFSELLTD